jgi:hypothetical protein
MPAPLPVTIFFNGEPKTLPAQYLNPIAREYWEAWLLYQARLKYNPLSEFNDKLQAIPSLELRYAAMSAYASHVDLNNVPKVLVLDLMTSKEAVALLLKLVTGVVATPDSAEDAFVALHPYIQAEQQAEQKEEIKCNSIAEANAIRAKLGKPPIGKKAEEAND